MAQQWRQPRLRRYGPAGWYVDGVEHPAAFAATLRERIGHAGVRGVHDVVPAETTVVVTCERGAIDVVGETLAAVDSTSSPGTGESDRATTLVEIDVEYAGDDLEAVADAVGCTVRDVIERHCDPEYEVAFCGFSPGFAYLTGGDPALELPRRASPRDVVPAGSVAIAGRYSAVYPSSTPGGWHLLGRTATAVWDTSWPSPALLTPGTRVRFVPSGRGEAGATAPTDPVHQITASDRRHDLTTGTGRPALRVVQPGWGSTLQDIGRVGYADVGVPRGGPVDPGSAAFANRVVGNPASAAVIETLGGIVVEALTDVVVAASDGPTWFALRPGQHFDIATPGRSGPVWRYLAISGGFAAPTTLGSVSHDTLSGLGAVDLEAGTTLAMQPTTGAALPSDIVVRRDRERVLDVWPGPQTEDVDGGLDPVTEGPWIVGGTANRVGLRLRRTRPERLQVRGAETLPSQGLVPGAIQVTPSGELVVMLANHPTTGGYPVIGVVDPDLLGWLAQRRSGAAVRFRPADG